VGRVLDPAFTVGGSSRAHPAQVNVDTGGFAVVHDTNGPAVVHVPSTTPDPGFGVFDLSRVLQSGVLNNGDVYSLLAQNKPVAAPLQEAGDPTLTSGPLGLASVVAAVLGEHVNKTSHKNPHGLAASDLPITPLVTAYPAGSDGDGPIATAPLNLMSVVASVLAAHVNKTSHKNPHGLGAGDFGFTWASNSNGWTITIPASPTPILLQLGQIASMGGGDQNQFGVTFPTRFPNACFGAFAVTRGAFSPFYDRITFVKDGATTASGCTVCNNGSGAGATWFAIGN
jgi:hypothetical protein